MDVRRIAAVLVEQQGMPVSQVARELKLSRTTVYRWVKRASVEGIANLKEKSRCPHSLVRHAVADETVRAILEEKAKYPHWGAKKLLHRLWGDDPPCSLRTADRILERHGLVKSVSKRREAAPIRFEREQPNELWQMDFKGMGSPRLSYSPLSVIDDASRFALAFTPVLAHTAEEVWQKLWMLFAQYGLPEAILSDNEGCFASPKGLGPSQLEARLWRLGIRTPHGRPAHPQTQGKVERFHRTVELELGPNLRHQDPQKAKPFYDSFLARYNWERPHEALDMQVPGAVYRASSRPRPDTLPEAPILGKARKVDASGKLAYKGRRYRAGKGLAGEWADIHQEQVFYAKVLLGSLQELEV